MDQLMSPFGKKGKDYWSAISESEYTHKRKILMSCYIVINTLDRDEIMRQAVS